MTKLLYYFDLAGVAVFASSGALAAITAGLDLLGVIVIAAVTAIGGGTLRDLLLNRHPVFWIQDTAPLLVIIASTVATIAWIHWLPTPINALLIADALGLAVFSMSGARLAAQAGCRPMVTVLMGTLTGVGGGVIRDVLSAQVPFILRQDIYATAAIAGIIIYLALRGVNVSERVSFITGLIFIAMFRLTAFSLGWHLPTFKPMAG